MLIKDSYLFTGVQVSWLPFSSENWTGYNDEFGVF